MSLDYPWLAKGVNRAQIVQSYLVYLEKISFAYLVIQTFWYLLTDRQKKGYFCTKNTYASKYDQIDHFKNMFLVLDKLANFGCMVFNMNFYLMDFYGFLYCSRNF